MDGNKFELLVRRMARIRWNLPEGAGGSTSINGQEIDAVCRTEDNIHLVMCTVEKKQDKVERDAEKLAAARSYLVRTEGAAVQCWELTLHEPTHHQRLAAMGQNVQIMTLAEFQRRFMDVEEYISRRKEYQFGSATDPETEQQSLATDEYVECEMTDATGSRQSIQSLTRLLEDGRMVVLSADFGAGKSLTVREVFFALCERYRNADQKRTPLAINLREHWGQTSVAEVLERHARSIAYPNPNQLVRVWNSGAAVLLLDGFDELSVQPLVSSTRGRREARRAATDIIRKFVQQGRGQCGLLITGRAQFFDSTEELRSCFDLRADDLLLELQPFTDEKATEYLRKKEVDTSLPAWLPRSPLLLGYLAARRLLSELSEVAKYENPVTAWDKFLDRIFTREAAVSSEYDGATIRRLMERLATRTRLTVGGARELDDMDIGESFREVTHATAYDATNVVLQRLPGLTNRTSETGRRSFVAREMLEVLSGADVSQFLVHPFVPFSPKPIQHPLSRLGCEVAAEFSSRTGILPQKHVVAAKQAMSKYADGTLAADCLLAAGHRTDVEELDCDGLVVMEANIDELDVADTPLANLTFHACAIGRLNVSGDSDRLALSACVIDVLEGVTAASGLPEWVRQSEVSTFDQGGTTASLMSLNIPLPVKVGLTVLKKLYAQRGSGRKENAFSKGLDQQGKSHVNQVLAVLRAENLTYRGVAGATPIWHAIPKERPRAMAILASPMNCGDPVVAKLAALN